MTQSLISDHYPYIPIIVTVKGQTFSVEALIDTGFDGAVILPEDWSDSMPGLPDGSGVWIAANGTEAWSPQYFGQVRVEGFDPSMTVRISMLGQEALVGRLVVDRFRVTLDHGERVIVEP